MNKTHHFFGGNGHVSVCHKLIFQCRRRSAMPCFLLARANASRLSQSNLFRTWRAFEDSAARPGVVGPGWRDCSNTEKLGVERKNFILHAFFAPVFQAKNKVSIWKTRVSHPINSKISEDNGKARSAKREFIALRAQGCFDRICGLWHLFEV